MAWKVLGVGSPLTDLLLDVDDAFLKDRVSGAKGGMEMVEPETIPALLEVSGTAPRKVPGGSAGNTLFALAKMGVPCAMLGKLGADPDGDFYRAEFRRNGGDDSFFVVTRDAPTGTCLSLVTPDAERTMRSALGASLLLTPDEVKSRDYSSFDLVFIEGYMLLSSVFDVLLESARAAGCRIGFDLASFEVAGIFREKLLKAVLPGYVDLLFANEEEGAALLGKDDPALMAEKLGAMCETVVLKSGIRGSIIKRGAETVKVPAFVVHDPVDTTAAGDLSLCIIARACMRW